MSVSIRLLNAEAVRELLPLERCIPLMRQAMVLVAQNKARQPIRQFMNPPDGRGQAQDLRFARALDGTRRHPL